MIKSKRVFDLILAVVGEISCFGFFFISLSNQISKFIEKRFFYDLGTNWIVFGTPFQMFYESIKKKFLMLNELQSIIEIFIAVIISVCFFNSLSVRINC